MHHHRSSFLLRHHLRDALKNVRTPPALLNIDYVRLTRLFSQRICYLDPTISRFSPKLIYWIFITSGITSLSLQGAGGGISSTTSGTSKLGENISLAGLCFQVFTLIIFILLAVDYLFRFYRLPGQAKTIFRFKVYLVFMFSSIVLILGRCVYRIDELKDGYHGALFHNQGLFCGLESVYVFFQDNGSTSYFYFLFLKLKLFF
jgi:RTA1 like protein